MKKQLLIAAALTALILLPAAASAEPIIPQPPTSFTTVTLWADVDEDGVFGTASDLPVLVTQTDAYARWHFDVPSGYEGSRLGIVFDVRTDQIPPQLVGIPIAGDINRDHRIWNGVPATLWEDKDANGIYGTAGDVPALASQITWGGGDFRLNGWSWTGQNIAGVVLDLGHVTEGTDLDGIFWWDII